ncbi:unnamed protein product [Acanthocheilonema viteae]|uniref:Potassium channel domain-containing protein n=1 Tax=Acanthocheilonema viteae TaxID=6277 RepID=A0A498SFD5_ACAVI|nr:unnamed protein product [Acanthocheilonema viteae]
MCISNETAIKVAKAFKQFYHKFGIGHIVLLIGYIIFLLFAAGIFMILETVNVNRLRKHWLDALAEHRKSFIVYDMVPQIFNNTKLLVFIHDDKSPYLMKTLNEILKKYEDTLKIRSPKPMLPCNYINSLIFIWSTVTTIGNVHIYPTTEGGRYFSMICAMIGIPFTFMVIKDLSYLIAVLFRYPCACFVYCWHIFRYCTLQSVDENELIQQIHGINAARYSDYSRAYWVPGRMYMPMTTKVSSPINYETESFDSSNNLNFISDCPLNHYVTLGVLQSEKENAYVDVNTQTESSNREYVPQCIQIQTPEALLIDKPNTSRDDVNDLIVETYGARPARIISSCIKFH